MLLVRNRTGWTEEEDAELWRLHMQGLSKARMSIRLRRTRRAIEVRLSLLRRQQQQFVHEQRA